MWIRRSATQVHAAYSKIRVRTKQSIKRVEKGFQGRNRWLKSTEIGIADLLPLQKGPIDRNFKDSLHP